MRILVSGFEAFGPYKVNPTALLAEQVNTCSFKRELDVRGLRLPVGFSQAYTRLAQEVREFDPHVVLALGLGADRNSIDLERVAINCIDADIADNKGVQPHDAAIDTVGASAYFSTLPLRQLLNALVTAGLPSRISNSAGTYVCNYVFYKLLQENCRTERRCGFIHFPLMTDQGGSRGPKGAALSFEEQLRGLEAILTSLSSGAAQ